MTQIQSHLTDPRTGKAGKNGQCDVRVFECLVVATTQSRGQMLAEAAAFGGWKTTLCSDLVAARSRIERTRFELAIVDLEFVPRAECGPMQGFVERVTQNHGLLVVLCGHDGAPEEERWARRQGVWFYLPAVTDTGGLAMLCDEARHIAARLSPESKVGGNQEVLGKT